METLFRFFLVVFLLFPFFVLIYLFPSWSLPETEEFLWAAKNTFCQAGLSALISIVLGFWLALGLLFLSHNFPTLRRLADVLCLAPSFLPPIFVLLAVLNLVDPFPTGLAGIVLIHVWINSGFMAVMIAAVIELRAGRFMEIAWVLGASRWRILFDILIPLIRRDLMLLFAFVFALCFSSFAIPLVVGGGKGTTLEVLIYEKIRISYDWGPALSIAVFQSLFVLLVGGLSSMGRGWTAGRGGDCAEIVSSPLAALVILSLGAALLWGWLEGIFLGAAQWKDLVEFR
ncbi:MAG: ABC transporter permease subunit, partial [Bdellovibrionaceae bacterium]|nr:ABC transporter permease subunit [Pseudobdellovibrionaceae bacterium]